MRKAMFCLFAMLLCDIAFGQETIKIGYFYLEPFTIAKEGTKDPIGVTVDYWEKFLAPKMGVKTQWVGPLPIARMYRDLETGELDAIFVSVINPDREKIYLFPTKHYIEMHPCLWLLRNHPLVRVTKVDDLFDWRIGFVKGSAINPFLKNDKVTIDEANGVNYKKMNFDKLLAKRLDAVYDHNEFTLAYEAKRLKIADKVKVILLPLDPPRGYIAFAKTERGARFLKSYEPINDSVVATNAVKDLVKKYTGQ